MAEPVQVYLAPTERARLERLTEQLSASKSDVIRRGLEALELQLTEPSSHPVLKLIGMVEEELPNVSSANVAKEHDRLLDEGERSSWDLHQR